MKTIPKIKKRKGNKGEDDLKDKDPKYEHSLRIKDILKKE